MLYCERCKISIRTEHKACPLCYGGLSGTAIQDDAIFPNIPIPKKRQVSFLSMLSFCCVLAFVFSYVVNHFIKPENKWFLYVTGGAAFAWIILVWGKSNRKNLLKNTIGQTIIVGLGLSIFDVFSRWQGWSVDFVLPISICLSLVFNVVITFVRKLPASEYMIYLLINGIMGLLPWLLIQIHIVKFILPSLICSGFGMVLLAGLLIFQWDHAVQELVKKFHI